MKIMKFYSYILILFLVFLSGCREEENGAVTAEATTNQGEVVVSRAQYQSRGMEVQLLTERDFPQLVTTTGRVDVPPANKASINALVGGYIREIPLLEGDKVRRGQHLATLENPAYVELQQEYLEVTEQMNFLRSDFERQQTLMEENITSQKNFLKAESDYKRNLARANGLRQKLQMLNIDPTAVEAGNITRQVRIYAPIEGSVSRVDAVMGEFVSPTQRILEIVNTNHIHLELAVFERDAMKVKEGQRVDFTTPEASSETFTAEVYLVGRSIDNETRTVPVHAHLADSIAQDFAVGMFVDARIRSGGDPRKSLPEEAVVEEGERFFVLVLERQEGENYYFVREEVRPLATFAGYTAVEDTEKLEGKQVLVSGAFDLIGE